MTLRAALAALSVLLSCAWCAQPGTAAGSPAAPDEIVALSASSTAVLGEPLTVQAEARSAPGDSLALDMKLSATDYFAITSVQEAAPAGGGRFRLQLIPLDIGRRSIPIYWTLSSGGSSRTVRSVLQLEVREPPEAAAAQALRDIKPPRRARPRLWPWLLAAALLAGAWYAHRRFFRRRLGPAAAAAAEARPPEAVAEAELSSLEDSGLWAAGRHKEFYAELTEIMRRYFERRFAFPATSQTTWELLRRLRAGELDRALLSLCKDLFDKADLVKFAQAPTQGSWGAADLETARRLVHETTPRPAPVSELPAPGGAP